MKKKISRIFARKGIFATLSPQNGAHMREKHIEQKLAKAVKHMGGIAMKFVSPGFDGMPDRLVLLPGGRMGFVEVKTPGKAPRPLQTARHRMLRKLDFKTFVLDDEKQIQKIISEIGGDAG